MVGTSVHIQAHKCFHKRLYSETVDFWCHCHFNVIHWLVLLLLHLQCQLIYWKVGWGGQIWWVEWVLIYTIKLFLHCCRKICEQVRCRERGTNCYRAANLAHTLKSFQKAMQEIFKECIKHKGTLTKKI